MCLSPSLTTMILAQVLARCNNIVSLTSSNPSLGESHLMKMLIIIRPTSGLKLGVATLEELAETCDNYKAIPSGVHSETEAVKT
ncbi:hypothetical protein EDD16DRAFT_1161147 [Pisolithus croceorrhizus]|nr:hypothetical protein EDD16DRAFT_1161147 [Pisolithus croceorrhizus]KAI6169329.1 hypothetical protein EDD17DRAFT_2912 [Pisolithus thermaeus]